MLNLLRFLAFVVLLPAVLFVAAGRFDLPFAWGYVFIVVGAMLAVLLTMDRDLMAERMRPGPGGEDRHLRFIAAPFSLGHLALGGLDIGRMHWSDTVPAPVQVAGLVGMAASLGMTAWAVRVNRYFSPVVRIQTERGHHLIDQGPYRWIRHPGYLATLAVCLCAGPALGSWLSAVPLTGLAALVLRRTILEDRFLHAHLDGYPEYARRVRRRLIPGIW